MVCCWPLAEMSLSGIRSPNKLRADEGSSEVRRAYACHGPLSVCALVRQPHIDGLFISCAAWNEAGFIQSGEADIADLGETLPQLFEFHNIRSDDLIAYAGSYF